MKLISWNVNGIRACLKKGFEEFFKTIDADIFCVQETKMKIEEIGENPSKAILKTVLISKLEKGI